MTNEAYHHLPLARAALCASCEAVYRVEEAACTACGDPNRIILSKVLGSMVPCVMRTSEPAHAAQWVRQTYVVVAAPEVAS